jgi:nifR3 family TIM-barrel protein
MNSQLAELINRPLAIGSRKIANRLILAPMTGLGHVAFRQWLDELGWCGLMYSEMCSAARIPQENRFKSAYFRWRDEEAGRLVVQIVGSDAWRMARAARRIENEGLFGVDINLGCSVKDICRYHQGAALLKNPRAALKMVETICRAVSCPVTVKYRTGWRDDPRPAVDLARGLADVGVDALIFHPRVAPDVRTRPPRWAYIGLVKEAVTIPVFGNGNVFDAEDCLKMFLQTGCDGVALGRIAVARPWIFREWSQDGRAPDRDYLKGSKRLLQLLAHHYDPARALRRFRQYASYLAANFSFGNTLFNRIRSATDADAVEKILDDFFDSRPRELLGPNMNFLR